MIPRIIHSKNISKIRQKDYPQNPCAIVNDMLQRLCPLHKDTNDVLILRNLVMILLGFAGFLRFDKISSLKCNNILVEEEYVKLLLRKVKMTSYM